MPTMANGGKNRSVYVSEPLHLQVTIPELPDAMAVRGGRRRPGPFYYGNPDIIRASDPKEQVQWSYVGGDEPTSGEYTWDIRPDLFLDATFVKEDARRTRRLRPVNVTGIYSSQGLYGGCIVKDDGTLHGWGSDGLIPPTSLKNVNHLCASRLAYASLGRDGKVSAWGDPAGGGIIPNDIAVSLTDVAQLSASGRAFAALKKDGSVVTWGDPKAGGIIPSTVASRLIGVDRLVGSEEAFAARNQQGDIIVWGGAWPYGAVINVAKCATQIVATNLAFAALMPGGKVTAWGATDEGGLTTPNYVPGLENIAWLASSSRAFSGITTSGQVKAWGDPLFGGVAPQGLSEIIYLLGASSAFAVLRQDGSVVSWGNETEGGKAPTGLDALTLTSGWGTFIALLRNGDCLSWGRIAGSRTSRDVVAAYVAGNHVVALCADESVFAWGNTPIDLSPLKGKVTHSFAIEASDRRS